MKKVRLFIMFWIFFKIGAFTLGGGFAMIPLMKAEFVDKLKWIDEDEFMDIIAVSQCAPGAVAINSSIYIGYRLYGYTGAVVAALGTVLPSFIIITCGRGICGSKGDSCSAESFQGGVSRHSGADPERCRQSQKSGI